MNRALSPHSRPRRRRKPPSRDSHPTKLTSHPRATTAIRRLRSSGAFWAASPSSPCPWGSCFGASASNAAKRRARLLLLYSPIVPCRFRRRFRGGAEMSHRLTSFKMPSDRVTMKEVLAQTCKVDKLRDLIGALLVMFSHPCMYDHYDFLSLVTRYDTGTISHYTQTEHDIGYRNKARPMPVATRCHRGRK